jgi:hypothetical protein
MEMTCKCRSSCGMLVQETIMISCSQPAQNTCLDPHLSSMVVSGGISSVTSPEIVHATVKLRLRMCGYHECSLLVLTGLFVGRCASSGACLCFAGFTGEHCDIEASLASSKECHTDADCAPGHVCDGGTGMCFVTEGTCGAVQACDMDTTCSGNGR